MMSYGCRFIQIFHEWFSAFRHQLWIMKHLISWCTQKLKLKTKLKTNSVVTVWITLYQGIFTAWYFISECSFHIPTRPQDIASCVSKHTSDCCLRSDPALHVSIGHQPNISSSPHHTAPLGYSVKVIIKVYVYMCVCVCVIVYVGEEGNGRSSRSVASPVMAK